MIEPPDTSLPGHLQRLNPEQFRAVTTLDGPLLILAGAGSGKTRVLTRRIAQLLHEGVEPNNILAVTFTRKAAHEMKERVQELVGAIGTKVWVSTFHATCCRILRAEIEALGWSKRFAIFDDDDQRRLIKEILKDLDIDPKRFEPRALVSQIDWYKNRMMPIELLLRQKRRRADEPLIRVWQSYQERLKVADAVDFNDLIGLTVQMYREHPAILEKWQDTFQYIMVDEYQDTNKGQYELLRMLASKRRNLAVVGDDDQSIYGFRGADISNILNFEKDYPEATTVRMEQNYRCSGNILAVANSVVAHNSGRIAKKLWTEAPEGKPVQFLVGETLHSEANKVARAILALRRHGHPYTDICIIYRTNATSRWFERSLREAGIPHRVIGGRKFYERREVRDTLAYLRLVVNPADDAAFLRVVNIPSRGVGTKTLNTLRSDASTRGEPLLRTARSHASGKSVGARGLRTFVTLIEELTEAARTTNPSGLVQIALERSGYRSMLEADRVGEDGEKLSRDAKTRLANLDELVRDAHQFEADLEAPLTPIEELTLWLDRIALAGQDEEIPEGGEVTLMTAHNAKGLEYPVVFVVQMMEGHFPHERSLEEENVEEERRLAYVAFTRGMQRLVITRSRTTEPLGGGARTPVAPSRFLYGIPEASLLGDHPIGEPGLPEPTSRTLTDPTRTKLQSFLARRAAKAQEQWTPSEEFVLHDLEDPSQLRKNVKVHHDEHGFGIVRAMKGSAIEVDFGSGRTVRVPLVGSALQLVQE